MTQDEITKFVESADEIIKRECSFHSTNGFSCYDFRIAKDGNIYDVYQIYDPMKTPTVEWGEPEFISNGHQLKLNLKFDKKD